LRNLNLKNLCAWLQIFFVLCLLLVNDVKAEDQPLSLEVALSSAIASHPDIIGKRNEYAGAQERLSASKWQRFPSVSLQTSAGQNSTQNNTQGIITMVRVEEPLWAGGRITGSIDSARAKMLASEQSIYEREYDILIKTATAFCDLMRLNLRIESSKESIAEHQRLLELIQRRARNEINPMSEIVLAKSRLEQAKSENIQFLNDAANAKADLENLIGHPVKSLQNPKYSLNMPEELSQAVRDAIDYSPTLKRLAAESAAAEADITVAKSKYFPELSARSDTTSGSAAPGTTAYLALTYAPGNGLAAVAGAREAETKKEVAEAAIQSAKIDINNKVRTDWNRFNSQTSQMEVMANLVETTKGNYQSNVRQFTAGRKTWVEVLNAKKESIQAEYSLADAQWNGFLSGLRVQIATGLLSANTLALQ
jgi:adhesin transport system outer membrane protein